MSSAAGRHRLGRSRTRELAERRQSLVRLLIALFVGRIAVTVLEVAEEGPSWWSVLITLAIGIEAWRAWSVSRAGRAGDGAPEPIPDSGWDRFLRPIERRGPAVIYALTAVFVVAAAVVALLGNPHDVLLDVALIARELTTLFFFGVILAGYMSVRRAVAG